MKKKIIIGIIISAICITSFFIYKNVEIETEYIPETEIEDVEYRNTAVSLYFQNKETKSLQVETRLIDSKELLKNPYSKLIELLLEGPDTSSLENAIPQNTKLLNIATQGDCLIVNLSKEFVENNELTSQEKMNSIYSIVNTVTELKEITSVKILIEGIENQGFEEDGIRFDNCFVRTN